MRVAVLWTRLSGYLNACLKELAGRPGVELMVIHESASSEAPFDSEQFSWIERRAQWGSQPDERELVRSLRQFRPDVMLVSSWHIRPYRYALRNVTPKPLRVLCMDNQWLGTLRQRIGVAAAPVYVRPLYDAVFLPGERQARFARLLGFRDGQIWSGLYCPDWGSLQREGDEQSGVEGGAFGYLGRLSPEKGVEDLLKAYAGYRERVTNPWELLVAGEGPLSELCDDRPGVCRVGFVEPVGLRDWLHRIDCLVVPSRFEPWGVAVSEAAAAGLPIVASGACGAVPHLVHDYANGRVVGAGDVEDLEEAMVYMASRSPGQKARMGEISLGLAAPYTPERWATTVVEGAKRRLEMGGDARSL